MEAGGGILRRGYDAGMGGEDGLFSFFAIGHFGEDADDQPKVAPAPSPKGFFKRLFGG